MDTLENRRLVMNGTFMYKLMYDVIDVPSLKDCIRLYESAYATRNRNIALIDNHTTNYGQNAPMTRLLGTYNQYYDIFEQNSSI